MQESRKLQLNTPEFSGSSVVYVMSRDQRTRDNHALLFAQQLAAQHEVPLYVLFVLRAVPNRSREHYDFMLSGLDEVAATLKPKNIPFILRIGEAVPTILEFTKEVDAGALFFDFSPLTGARKTAKSVAESFSGPVTVVDTHNIIPVWAASDKQEFAAHTFRRKVHRYLENYVKQPPELTKHPYPAKIAPDSVTDTERQTFLESLPSNGITIDVTPGELGARLRLSDFLTQKLSRYARDRNDPTLDGQSELSPYLHFGQLSSLRVVLESIIATDRQPLLFEEARMAQAGDEPSVTDGQNALFEELIVRKELSDNFCFYNEGYTSLKSAPDWAQRSLTKHAEDPRDFVYSLEEWDEAQTHDDAWNAAHRQLRTAGKMHGYMRMYWAKKLLEWSASPAEAIKIAIHLNDKYSIDGGDPNGYVGILWSIAGLHDRPWIERPIFGQIRYMNAGGLKRKFDIQAYTKRWLNPIP